MGYSSFYQLELHLSRRLLAASGFPWAKDQLQKNHVASPWDSEPMTSGPRGVQLRQEWGVNDLSSYLGMLHKNCQNWIN